MVKWIFFDIGSTLVDETEAYDHRVRDMIVGTDISFSEFDDVRIAFAKHYMTGEISRKHFVIILENSLQEFSCITCCILPSDLTNRFLDKKKKPLTRYLLTHQQLLSCFVSVYYSVLQRFICFQHSP